MADGVLLRRGPLEGAVLGSSADRATTIAALPPAARFIIRGRAPVVAAAKAALGFDLPTEACRAATSGIVAALWLGPDEWLVIGAEGDRDRLAAALEDALAGTPHAVVDVSHRQSGVILSGPKVAFVIAHGCPLDLSLETFPVGMCTRTLVGRTEAVLWRTGEETFRIEVWRSFVSYLVAFLQEARREFE